MTTRRLASILPLVRDIPPQEVGTPKTIRATRRWLMILHAYLIMMAVAVLYLVLLQSGVFLH